MRVFRGWLPAAAAALAGALPAAAQDAFQFFKDEAQVVTASRRPSPLRAAPATVYVVTAEDIKVPGAQTLWDALRGVPGVEVMTSRTMQGDVGIRGLNMPLNNRTLVLLDGRTVLNGYFDFVIWEVIPVSLDEIDRIEVVEGPASALYGANATSGVINIITKRPEQLDGGVVSYWAGQDGTQFGSALYGAKKGKVGYKVDAGWRSTDRFEDSSKEASEAAKVNAAVDIDLGPDSKLGLSGGGSVIDTNITVGKNGIAYGHGPSGYARADYVQGDTRVRAFWNSSRLVARDLLALQNPNLDYDTYDATIERSIDLPRDNSLVVGGNYRKNAIRSSIFAPGLLQQDLWALFFEDQWKAAERWTVVASGRADRHPLAGTVFSPRAAVIYDPSPRHLFRLSAGTSFRNPTLLENYVQFSQTFPNPNTSTNPPFAFIRATTTGNPDLSPEKMTMVELAHEGRFGRLKTTAVAFHYKLKDILSASPATVTPASPNTLSARSSFINQGETTAWGGELGAEYAVRGSLSVFGNWSYQSLTDTLSSVAVAPTAPRNKLNAGVRYASAGWNASLIADYVDATSWDSLPPGQSSASLVRLPAYAILNARVAYRFSGAWRGLELGLSAFNLTNNRHYETLPSMGPSLPGENGEIVGSRWLGTASYRF